VRHKQNKENFRVACVASVSVGLSAGLKHFSLLERAKMLLSSVLRSPQFLRRQNAKKASNGRKTLRKRLLRRLALELKKNVDIFCGVFFLLVHVRLIAG